MRRKPPPRSRDYERNPPKHKRGMGPKDIKKARKEGAWLLYADGGKPALVRVDKIYPGFSPGAKGTFVMDIHGETWQVNCRYLREATANELLKYGP